jgi:hypothetical protein
MKTSSSRRYRRHRNPETTDQQEGPFFSPASKAIQTKENAFFQPKLTVGEPGDQYEKEADAVASKVVNKQPTQGTAVQRKEISAVQAMPEKKEEEKPVQKKGMNDKKEEEKSVQKKAMPEKKEEEKPVQKKSDMGKEDEQLQKKAAPEKKEEEKVVQKKDDKEEESLQKKAAPDKKEEEKAVQKKEEPEKKLAADEVLKEKDEEKKGGKPSLMAKENNSGGAHESDQLAQQLKDQRGDGTLLSREVRDEMSKSIGADFSNVRIHTGEKAAALSNELGAQAFTHGNDVYFNSGKYDADSSTGKHLLAHELTHVVQQGAAPAIEGKTSAAAAAHATPGVQREISTPLPEGVKPDEKSEVANFPVGSFKVEIRPDRKAKKEENIAADHAFTSGSIDAHVSYERNKNNRISKVTISKTLIIQTIYGADATSKGDSGYGRGHIKSDVEKGNKSLGFHEGNHGIDFMDYIKTHPFPEIVIKKPVTDAEFATLKAEWDVKHQAYVDDMLAISKQKTDDVTDPPAPAKP